MKSVKQSTKIFAVTILFQFVLLVFRWIYTKELSFGFYPWNTFLAIVPLFFSARLLKQQKMNLVTVLCIGGWLLFFPNAPYLVTDVFHFGERPIVPTWFDLVIVILGAWNGILLAILSLLQVEFFFKRLYKGKWLGLMMGLVFLLTGYGVYIGRYLRFNSWDIVTAPINLFSTSIKHIAHPFAYPHLWAFTIIFSFMLCLMYYSIKSFIPAIKNQQ
jgi:uncharacterized membrane protein